MIEGVLYRLRTGVPWRDLPVEFGPWQTVWKRHARFSRDGTWDAVLTRLLAEADAAGELDWAVSVDSTIVRAHQHSATAQREPDDPRRRGARRDPAGSQGAPSNYRNPPDPRREPGHPGLGRSRGGLSTKCHALVDGSRPAAGDPGRTGKAGQPDAARAARQHRYDKHATIYRGGLILAAAILWLQT